MRRRARREHDTHNLPNPGPNIGGVGSGGSHDNSDNNKEIEIYADKSRITQAISNIVGNTVKFTDRGTIRVVDEKMEALKHYFRITHSSELIARGIEIRRYDAPNFIKEFQTELLYTLFDSKESAEVISKGYDNALLLGTKTIDKVMTGEIQSMDLVESPLDLIFLKYK
jgi:hypothetical protein